MEDKTEHLQFNIQLATSGDLEEVVNIIRQTSKWLKEKGIKQWNENYPLSRLEEEVSKGELFVVLDSAQNIIGTLSLSQNKSEFWPDDNYSAIYLNRIALLRKHSGLSLGQKIINWAKEYSRKRNVSLLRLICDKTNPFLPNYYQRCGFQRIGESFYSPWKMTFLLFETKVN